MIHPLRLTRLSTMFGHQTYDISFDTEKKEWIARLENFHVVFIDNHLHSLLARMGAVMATEEGWP